MKQIKLIHASDLHLGHDFSGLGIKAVTRRRELLRTFMEITALAKKENIDLLLLTGDLFESWSIPDDTLSLVQQELAALAPIPVLIAAGNHDPLTPDAPYRFPENWSENVCIFPREFSSIVFDSLELEVWGASFPSSYVPHSLFQKVSPTRPEYLQIGMIHGTLGGAGSSEYNPISLQQIEESGLAYLALGHIHKPSGIQKQGQTYYAYPGCPEGMGFDELGPRGVLLGRIGKNHCDLSLVPLSQREYLEISVDLSSATGSQDAATLIRNALEQEQGETYPQHLYKIFLTGKLPDTVRISFDHIKALLSDIFFIKLRDRTQLDINLEQAAKERSLKGLFVSQMEKHLEGEEQEIGEIALQVGLKAFYGEVGYSED